MKAGNKRLAGDTAMAANAKELEKLRSEAQDVKAVVTIQALELRLFDRRMTDDWDGSH
ncbi:MAG: hypothetical protein AAGA12_08560 [Pseudomonadota bacterium]